MAVFVSVMIFCNLILWYASETYIRPAIKPVFKYVLHNSVNERYAQYLLNNFGHGDGINSLVATVCVVFRTFILSYTCIFAIQFIASLITFKSVTKILSFKKFKLENEGGLVNDMKFIAIWIILYSLCNLIIQTFGFSDFLYQKFSILCQGTVFFLLIFNNCFGYKIKKRPRAIKT